MNMVGLYRGGGGLIIFGCMDLYSEVYSMRMRKSICILCRKLKTLCCKQNGGFQDQGKKTVLMQFLQQTSTSHISSEEFQKIPTLQTLSDVMFWTHHRHCRQEWSSCEGL